MILTWDFFPHQSQIPKRCGKEINTIFYLQWKYFFRNEGKIECSLTQRDKRVVFRRSMKKE
jgi:hypothetical protein